MSKPTYLEGVIVAEDKFNEQLSTADFIMWVHKEQLRVIRLVWKDYVQGMSDCLYHILKNKIKPRGKV